MPYTPDIGREFWFQFDNQFLWEPTPAALDALQRAYVFNGTGLELDHPVDLFRVSFAQSTHPAPFLSGLQANQPGFIDLARIQAGLINNHLPATSDVQSAFEDFAQGVLFDDRRLTGFKVHKMDGDPANWVGYHRWNAFARATELFGEQPSVWQFIGRCIGLAWAIQSEAQPQDDTVNPGLPAERLQALRNRWLNMSTSTLDWAFATHRFAAPTTVEIDNHEPSGFARVQRILETATPTGNPLHKQNGVSLGRFWLRPYSEFINLSVYNKPLIADDGPDRGARSGLVKVLRGQLAGVPRMPRAPLPPVPDSDIQFISDWIDAGMPEH